MSHPFGRTGVVIKPYRHPYPDPIRVTAGERILPDFTRETDVPGWVWCTDRRGRSGWTPREWLREETGNWRVIREFNAIELTVDVGLVVTLHEEIAGFYWVTTQDGRTGWLPCETVHVEAELP